MKRQAKPQNWKNGTWCIFYSLKQIIKEAKLPSQTLGGLILILFKKALSNNKLLVRKVRKDKMQVLHRLRLRLFEPGKPIPNVQTTSHEWKLDTEVIIKHDDFYDRAKECESETPSFDSDRDGHDNHNLPETTVRHDLANVEKSISPVASRGGFPEVFPEQMDYVTELTRITIWSLMRKQIRSSVTILMLIPAAQTMICATNLNRILIFKSVLVQYPENLRIPNMDVEKVLRKDYATTTYLPTKLLVSRMEKHQILSIHS